MRAREHVWVTEWARAYVHAGTAEVYLNGGVEPKKKRERGSRVSHQLSVNPCFLSSTLRKRVLPIYCSRTSGFLSALIGGWKKRAASSALAAACVPERRCSRSGLGPIQQSGKCLFRWVPRGRGWEGDFKLGQSKFFFFTCTCGLEEKKPSVTLQPAQEGCPHCLRCCCLLSRVALITAPVDRL